VSPRASAAANPEGPVQLGREPVSATVPLAGQARAAFAEPTETTAGAQPPRVILHLEGITADGPPGNYEVYLNYPEADRTTAGSVPHYVGLLAGFGSDHHHDHGAGEDGEASQHGLSASFDITGIVSYLRANGGWDESQATVTFVPAARPRPGFELKTAGLRIGRISIETE
jgi:hypothetical protein